MGTENIFTLMYPARIIFGRGVIERLAEEILSLGKRALLVTGCSAMRKSGVLDRVGAIMKSAGVEFFLFDGVESDPSLETVNEGIEFIQRERCDVVIGLGGGSAIDVAKAIASIVKQPGTVWEYHRGKKIEKEGLPFIAVPTTAGTGAEITNNSVLMDREKLVKKSIRSPHMIAKVALVDPELTLSIPPRITAYTGMDAFVQALESYVTKTSNPITDTLALQAIEVIFHNLPEAVQEGGNIEVREKMALGSLLSAMAFSNSGLGAVHGLAHPIGAHFGVPHGLACAVLLPHVVGFNLKVRYEKFSQIAEKIGVEKTENLPCIMKKFLQQIGIPLDFRDYEITETDFSTIIAESRSSSMSKNPRQASDEDLREILRRII
ncbi:iron-containing alcohol dehydrogenase [Candidatus Aerophobetes bacterium]|uniref:Iron-containing alcohol dehydrogenase n=1 Tax=Aerophobetes bacterium TaxID=2030807 RepID=A0A523RWP7_UNCAE|nr:MAG: iron-containing alcohol dehydrogenase [Candidatus Aerophobetes bacterium]